MKRGAGAWPRTPRQLIGLLILLTLLRRLHSPKNRIQEIAFRQSPFKGLLSVYHCLGYSLDAIEGDKVREFGSFNTVSRNLVALHCKLVSQAHRPRAVWSRGSDKNLKMNRLAYAGKPFFALGCECGFAF